MKRLVFVLTIFVLTSGTLHAGYPIMGCYFDFVPGAMQFYPAPLSFFDVYIYLHNTNYYVTAVEYQLVAPDDPTHMFFVYSTEIVYPDNKSITDGDPFSGHRISYWPPLNGYAPRFNMICKIEAITTEPCYTEGGLLADYRLLIGPHPVSGYLQLAIYPEMISIPINGLFSVLCPLDLIGAEESTWGAIKSMVGE